MGGGVGESDVSAELNCCCEKEGQTKEGYDGEVREVEGGRGKGEEGLGLGRRDEVFFWGGVGWVLTGRRSTR